LSSLDNPALQHRPVWMLLAPGVERSFRAMIAAVPLAPESMRVAHDLDWSALQGLYVVHVGQAAAILSRPRGAGLLPLSWGDRGLVPGGIALGHQDGRRTRALLATAHADGRTVDLRGWATLDPLRRPVVDLCIATSELSRAAVGELTAQLAALAPAPRGPGMDPGPQRALAPELAGAVVGGDAAAEAVASRLIGAGPGATPAGDDVVVGVLAGLRVAGNAALLDAHGRAAQRRLAAWIPGQRARTTQAGAHDLAAAARGSFSEHVLDLVDALGAPDLVAPAVARARRWGATSGLDLAHGVLAGVQTALLATHDPHRTAA
jgi:hypothetical protein